MKFSVLSSVLPELTAEEVAKAIALAGYDGVEWRVNGEYHFPEATIEKEAPRIKALCDAHGIEIAENQGVRLLDLLSGGNFVKRRRVRNFIALASLAYGGTIARS